jgi:hypothetical protein
MKNEIIKIEIAPIPAPPAPSAPPIRWQTCFVWLVIFITGVVVGMTIRG